MSHRIKNIFSTVSLILLVFITGCSSVGSEDLSLNVTIFNPPSSVIIDNPYILNLSSNQDVFLTILLNDSIIIEDLPLKAKQTESVEIFFNKSRDNKLRLQVKNRKGEIKEFTYENLLCLPKVHVVIDKNYSGNDGDEIDGRRYFKSILKAIAYLVLNQNKYAGQRIYIYIKNGDYYEKINIGLPNISLIGEDVDRVRIYYDLSAGSPGAGGTSGSASVTINSSATGFTAENITFENSFDEIANANITSKQAVAVLTQSDKAVFKNCKFIGNQDTLYIRGGLHYFVDCYIEGDVDFIFGDGKAVFENCTIFSVDKPGITPKGYVTAASTKIGSLGFLFENCKLLTNISTPNTVYLGRPWHPSSDPYSVNSNVVFRNCYMDQHIHPDGWTAMSSKDPETGETIWFYPETERFYEYQNYGPGAMVNDNRRQLSGDDINIYSKENFLEDWKVEEFIEHLYEN